MGFQSSKYLVSYNNLWWVSAEFLLGRVLFFLGIFRKTKHDPWGLPVHVGLCNISDISFLHQKVKFKNDFFPLGECKVSVALFCKQQFSPSIWDMGDWRQMGREIGGEDGDSWSKILFSESSFLMPGDRGLIAFESMWTLCFSDVLWVI